MRAFLAAAVAVALAIPGCVRPGEAEGDSLQAALDGALDYLLAQRGPDGAWDPAFVPHVAEAGFEAGEDLAAWPAERSMASQASLPPAGAPYLSALRPLHAAALAPHGAGRAQEIQDRVLAGWDGRQFGDPALLNDDVFALRVLAQLGMDFGAPGSRGMPGALLANQTGGWPWAVGGSPEADVTGMALAALDGAGALGRADRAAALAFLGSTRTPDGGHSLSAGGARGNCDSTVWALRAYALLAAPPQPEAWSFLRSLRQPDGGFAYLPGGGSNGLCTAEAAALLGLAARGEVPVPADVFVSA